MAAQAYILQENDPMGIAEFFSRKKNEGMEGITLTSEDCIASHNHEIIVFAGDRDITISLPKIKGTLKEQVLYEVSRDKKDKGSGKIIVVDKGGLNLGKSTTYVIEQGDEPLRVMTNGIDNVLF